MFGWFGKRRNPAFEEIRRTLFGDVPLDEWRPNDAAADGAEPWSGFASARAALDAGDVFGAVAVLRKVSELPGLESRQFLQAWHFMRRLGVQPHGEDAKRVRGVVLEVHLPDGLDTLAAYADHTARYINHGGTAIVWEMPDTSMDGQIDALLLVGQKVADVIGPSKEPRRGPPPKGHVRVNMLTSSGLLFGEGPLDAFGTHPMAGPLLAAGAQLMQALMARASG